MARTASSLEERLENSPAQKEVRDVKMGASCIPKLYIRDLIRERFAEAPDEKEFFT